MDFRVSYLSSAECRSGATAQARSLTALESGSGQPVHLTSFCLIAHTASDRLTPMQTFPTGLSGAPPSQAAACGYPKRDIDMTVDR